MHDLHGIFSYIMLVADVATVFNEALAPQHSGSILKFILPPKKKIFNCTMIMAFSVVAFLSHIALFALQSSVVWEIVNNKMSYREDMYLVIKLASLLSSVYSKDNSQLSKTTFVVYFHCHRKKKIWIPVALCLDPTCGLQPPSFLVWVLTGGPERKATVLHLQLFQFLISASEMMLPLL